MREAFLYSRVSTARQADEGVSLEAQEAAMRQYCEARSWRPVEAFCDAGRSGTSRSRRPSLEAALGRVRASGGVLVVYSLSRLARSTRDALNILSELQDAGADLAIVDMAIDTSGPYGRFIFSIFSAIAELDSGMKGQLVKQANAHIVEKLGYRTMGQKPWGVSLDRETGARFMDRRVMRTLRKLHEAKELGLTAQQLADWANRQKIAAPGGGRWTRLSVGRQLRRDLDELAKLTPGRAPEPIGTAGA